MRGRDLLSVRVALSVAPCASTLRRKRWRSLGRCGGKGPGSGLFAAQQLYVAGEGQLGMRQAMPRNALVQQPAHRVVRQDPAEELLAHELGGLAAKYAPAPEQMRLELVEDLFDLPALVVQRRQLQRRRLLGIDQAASCAE